MGHSLFSRTMRRGLAAALVLLVLLPAAAQAHRIRPAVVSVDFHADARYEVVVRANFETWIAGIDATRHTDTRDAPDAPAYDRLRSLPAAQMAERIRAFAPALVAAMHLRFDDAPAPPPAVSAVEVPEVADLTRARVSFLTLRGRTPAGAKRFRWRLAPEMGSAVLKLGIAGDTGRISHWLENGAESPPFALDREVVPATRLQVAGTYTALGFTHIVPKGLDHILFVLGIFLLSQRLGPILWQVTAFTVAHTITLALSMYGVVSAPATLVEPLIAASIVYVGLENVLTAKLKPWRVVVVFAFGLLHGMGFAGVLTEIGLPRSEFVTALITFNIGVELGQLTVIAAAFLGVSVWFRREVWYRARVVIPASLAISLVGAWWTVERTLAV